MSFGKFVAYFDSTRDKLPVKGITVECEQRGFIVDLKYTQVIQTKRNIDELTYTFPTDNKICVYKTHFVVGDEVIEMRLKPKEQAEEIYEEAKNSGKTAAISKHIDYGYESFTIGRVPANTEVKAIFNCAFEANLEDPKTIFVKFPLELISPSGSVTNLYGRGDNDFSFKFELNTKQTVAIESVTTNGNSTYEKIDDYSGKLTLNRIPNSAIFIRTKLTDNFDSIALKTPKATAINFAPSYQSKELQNQEFVFVIDCSGSMSGSRISKARECLEIFIRSLPVQCMFNIVRFGSRFEELWKASQPYSQNSFDEAIRYVKEMQADLGGTNILPALESVLKNKPKSIRQIFILTDGEVNYPNQTYELLEKNKTNNRCFTIGLGSGADAGFVERVASITSGKSDFVLEGDDLSMKVIPQLNMSMCSSLSKIEVHVEGSQSFQITPFPIPIVPQGGSETIYIDTASVDDGILITGNNDDEDLDYAIPTSDTWETNSVYALFAYQMIRQMELSGRCDKSKLQQLSLDSGVICTLTAYVGVSQYQEEAFYQNECAYVHADSLSYCAPMAEAKCKAKGGFFSSLFGGLFGSSSSSKSYKKYSAPEIKVGCPLPPPPPPCGAPPPRSSASPRSRASPPPPPPPPAPSASRGFDLSKLLSLQNMMGFWEDAKEVIKLTKLKEVPKVNEADGAENQQRVIATVLALALLHHEAMEKKPVWQMIETKALRWLSGVKSDVKWNEVVERIAKEL
ncbi:von Willebrand factor type A domain containing protein [Histomonas meleagridis]|uniref:von Willebrand factor type A domain containing protein n=1 Tax=Histomonas meleagridis TaxID=135588 RepID=UPI0035597E8C|nr:von Willebrand factor type A domain containing protein [Histomonas meleagridis]KAH0798313.1 von Willebrand factor type A domain containing protein [Histomonas meleagridis]